MKILYKFATRSRPKKFFDRLEEIESLSVSSDFLVHVTIDEDDETMNTPQVLEALDRNPFTEYIVGRSAGKIDAINRDMGRIVYPWDICVVMSDDMHFVKHGFDNIIRAAFAKYFPDFDGCVHFKDGPYGKRLMALNIQGRKYFERFGYLYNPEYISLFCDNEQKDVAEMLGKYVYMGDDTIIVKHIHPAHVEGVKGDALLEKTESFYRIDEATYERRKKNNFGL
jgi:hypothetical protein